VVGGRARAKVTGACAALARAVEARLAGAAEVMGPAEAPLAKIAGNFRVHLIVRTNRFPDAHARVAAALQEHKAPSGVYVEVDVDPQALL
jgi:primosomal protein N' (replication factor Y)